MRDAAHVLDAMAGHDLRGPSSSEQPVPDLGRTLRGEVRLLRAIGVDILQGFALSRPMRCDDAIAAARAIPREFSYRFGSYDEGRILHIVG